MLKVDLSKYDNSWYRPGPLWKRAIWYCINEIFFKSGCFPMVKLKRRLLKMFGAIIGKHVVIKPGVSIKYPWLLKIGDNSWIGEKVWIDNLARVDIGANVCVSQGAYLLCGNHHIASPNFDLMVKPIQLEDGVWVGAKSIVCPGVVMATHSVLTAGSVLSTNTEAFWIYQGNPATKKKPRELSAQNSDKEKE